MARRAPREGSGFLFTLFGTAILLGLGFGVGWVAGAVLEAPDLVRSHVAGETEQVALPDDVSAIDVATPPPVEPVAPASERALGAPRSADAPEPSADPEPELARADPEPSRVPVAPPPPAPAPARSGFAVQVGAFADRISADGLATRLSEQSLHAYVVTGDPGEPAPFRVRVGPYASRDQAADVAARLKAGERLPTWVLEESPQ